MSKLVGTMQQAADVLADATIAAFWDQYDRRMSEAVANAGIRINPEVRLRGLVLEALQSSIAQGWIDPNTYAYQAFVYTDSLSVPEVMDYLAEQVAENGILTTHDLMFANELVKQIRNLKRQPPKKKGWFSWLVG